MIPLSLWSKSLRSARNLAVTASVGTPGRELQEEVFIVCLAREELVVIAVYQSINGDPGGPGERIIRSNCT
jgi:hypothetical protein|tara:strand:- start:42 stop:254 length:213 start_codon:yes stop_codon:yes gene_type:complete